MLVTVFKFRTHDPSNSIKSAVFRFEVGSGWNYRVVLGENGELHLNAVIWG